ncbi:MAG: ribonuclease P subunit p25 family protein [archaeon]|nr:ribonuclease P subunit p25 family protein [archaeon]
MSTTQPTEKDPGDIRIGGRSRAKYVIQYAQSIMKEKNLRELKFSAIGDSITALIDVVEIMKINIPGLYQQNKLAR